MSSKPASTEEILAPLLSEYREVELALADPQVHADGPRARKLGRRYAELGGIARAAKEWQTLRDDAEAAAELAADDESFAQELSSLVAAREKAYEDLVRQLAPRDEDDIRDVIMEIKAGEGGEESALFAADLMRMYTRFAETKGWAVQVLGTTFTGLGGIKDAQLAIRARGQVTPEEGIWSYLKHEGGVHRVQRVPVTESQGRIHTSAAGVLVMPEAEEDDDIEIAQADLRIDVFRSSGPGGQSVNTTDSAVRITHLPTGIVVSMQDEKSQLQNREAAMRVLRSRLLAEQRARREAQQADARHAQVRTVDRSERIRTYNFPENRVTDHRTGFKTYSLDRVIDGDLGAVVESCRQFEAAQRLAGAARE